MSSRHVRRALGHMTVAMVLMATVVVHAKDPLPLTGPAFRLADAAYKAYAQGRYAAAADGAREALRLRPDVPRLQVLLDQAQTALDCQKDGGGACAQDLGFQPATAAYKAYEEGRFTDAVADARRALEKSPGNASYHGLLVSALLAAELLEAADQASANAITLFPGNSDVWAKRQDVLSRKAQSLAMQSYDAIANLSDGVAGAKAARSLMPDVPAYRVLLAYALLQKNQPDEADRILESPHVGAPALPDILLLRGLVRQQLNRLAESNSDVDHAIALLAENQTAQLAARSVGADIALASAQHQRAMDLLARTSPIHPAGLARLRLARLQLAGHGANVQRPAPVLQCVLTLQPPVCALAPDLRLQDPSYPLAEQAYRYFETADYANAAALAEQAVTSAPDNRDYRLLLVNAYLAGGRYRQAESAASEAIAQDAFNAKLLVMRGQTRLRLSEKSQAADDFRAAFQLGGLTASEEMGALISMGNLQAARRRFSTALESGELAQVSDLDLAYLAIRIGDDGAALQIFDSVDQRGALSASVLQDAGYAATRVGNDLAALGYFKRTVDAAQARQLQLELQQLFETRRTISTIDRLWGITASVSYRSLLGQAATAGSVVSPAARQGSLQAGAEGYWRPFGYNNGSYSEFYARAFETLYNRNGGASGAQTVSGAVGARWKPLSAENLVLSVERTVALGSLSRSDWLVRAGYSDSVGTDLRLDVPDWWTAQVFLETGQYLDSRERYAVWEGQFGRSYRIDAIGPTTVLNPYLVIGGDTNSTLSPRGASGVGPGISLKYGFREDDHHAPRSQLELSMQYRFRLTGDDRRQGLFFQVTTTY